MRNLKSRNIFCFLEVKQRSLQHRLKMTPTLWIPMDLICSKYPDLLRNRDYKIIFALDTRFRTPGYTFLRILHFNEYLPITDFIHECLAELSPGQLYLSSDIWNNDIKLMWQTHQETQGLSFTISVCNTTDADIFYALECDCTDYWN